ncbi:MAG: hypothetical protein RJB66_598 [Pseudomonadota bacterium]
MRISQFLLIGCFLGLVASQSLMDLFFGLATLFGAYLLLFVDRRESKAIPFPLWLLLAVPWIAWIGVGFYVTPDSRFSTKAMGDFIWLAQVPLISLLWSKVDPKKDVLKPFLTILSIVCIYAIAIYFLGFDPLYEGWDARTKNLETFWRTGGLFSNPMPLAHSYGPLALIFLPISLYYFQKKDFKLIEVPLNFILLILTVLFSFTRGVWIALALATISGAFIFKKRVGLIAIAVTLIGGGLMMTAWPKFRERTLLVFDSQKSYDSERIILWKTNWRIFTDNPIAGIGYGENKRRLREFYDQFKVPQGQFEGHAHNQYLHFLAGTGLVGLLFYVIWCGLFLKLTHELYVVNRDSGHKELSFLILGLLLAQLAFHFGSLTESNFSISKNRMLLVFIWGFLIHLKRHPHQLPENNSSR